MGFSSKTKSKPHFLNLLRAEILLSTSCNPSYQFEYQDFSKLRYRGLIIHVQYVHIQLELHYYELSADESDIKYLTLSNQNR